jgi:hypothetical protein
MGAARLPGVISVFQFAIVSILLNGPRVSPANDCNGMTPGRRSGDAIVAVQ